MLLTFDKRGYPKKVVKAQLNLSKVSKPIRNSSNVPKFITKCHPGLHKINNLIKTVFPCYYKSLKKQKIYYKISQNYIYAPKHLKKYANSS